MTFVGRARQLGELAAALGGATDGSGGLVLLAGEAGIGKTRLCEELAARAAAAGVGVAWAACWESGATPAYWPWAQLVDQLTGTALAAPDPAPGEPPDQARARLFEDVAAALAGAAAAQPRLLLLDDLHWADPPSVLLLAHLAPRLRTLPVLLVATYRDDEVDPAGPVADLARHGRRVALPALDPADVGGLLRDVTGADQDDATTAAVHRHTRGNPLFARELARLLDADGALAGLATARGPLPVPATVRDVLDRRLRRLPPDCRAALEVGAVAGDGFDLAVVGEVLGGDVLAVVDDAAAAGVVREAGPGRLRFSHPLVRSTLYGALGVARRVRLHQRVGEALEARRAAGHEVDVAALAHHFLQAAPAGTAGRAVACALDAAGLAMAMLAWEDAAELYRQALAALDLAPGAADRAEVLLALGAAHVATGDQPAARTAYLSAVAAARLADRPDQLARAALGVGSGGGFEVEAADREQVDLLEEARRALGPDRPALLAEVTARLAVALPIGEAMDRRVGLADEALALARESGDGAVLAATLAAHCDAVAGPAHAERRRTEAGEIVALAQAGGDRRTELLGLRLRMVALLEAGDMPGADADIDAYAALAALVNQPLYDWYVPLWRGMRALMRGDLAAADRFREEAAARGAQAHSANAVLLTEGLHWYLLSESGRVDEPLGLVEGLLGFESALGLQMRVATALILAEAGRTEDARAMLDGAAPGLPGAPVDSEWVPSMSQAAQAVFLVGGHPVAGWLYDSLLPHRGRFGVEGIGCVCWGSVERPLAFLAAALGRPGDAKAHLDAALAANRALGAPLLVARTLRDRALVVGDGDARAAAAAAYRELGMDRRAAELEGPSPPAATTNRFVREGGVWALRWAGTEAHVKDVKGMRDLAALLARPGKEVAAVDLAGRGDRATTGGDLGEVVDGRARAAYRARLAALEAELDEADARGDATASARVGRERAALVAQLSAAVGLGGRPRKAGDPAERARVAVTWRVRDAIARVEAAHPGLGRHLRRAVRTGTFCCYDPDPPADWDLTP